MFICVGLFNSRTMMKATIYDYVISKLMPMQLLMYACLESFYHLQQ